jgi:transcriptional regulator with XRE-family HTH domain
MKAMEIDAAQIRAARAMLSMRQEDLADASGLTRKALAAIEAGSAIAREPTLQRIRAALEQRGVEFLDTAAGRGVILRR